MLENHPNPVYLTASSSERIVLTDELITLLSQELNKIHDSNYSERFWKIVAGPYINSVISRMTILSSQVITVKPLFEPINGVALPSKKERLIKSLRNRAKSMQTSKNYNTIVVSLKDNDNVALGFHDPLSLTNDIGAVYLPDYFHKFSKRNNIKRHKVNTIAQSKTDLYLRNIISQLPEIYVEYFDEMLSVIPLYNPEKKILHTSFIDSFYMKFLVGIYLEKGAGLNYYQHGAYYGEITNHNAHRNESGIADKFVTWGWKINDNDVPGKAYRLEKFKRDYNSVHDSSYSYDLLFCYPKVNNRNIKQLKEYTEKLSGKLDRQKYKRLLARPRPTIKIPFISNKIGFNIAKDISIDAAKKPMYEVLAKSRLVIQFTIPSTNFFECLYVNHPTIGILSNDNPTDIVKPYYDFFLQIGVLHNDFDSLVNHLNKVNVDEWWKEVTGHPVYKEFKDKFLKAV